MPYKRIKPKMTINELLAARRRMEAANKALADMRFTPHRRTDDTMFGDEKNVVDHWQQKYAAN